MPQSRDEPPALGKIFHTIKSRRETMFRKASLISILAVFAGLTLLSSAFGQEAKAKIRIANSAMSVTSLPLVAARDWKIFREQGLDVEIILMSPAITVPAMISGEIAILPAWGLG
jgi:ABC-type nitrate/sulfonate/bicarbonate transport system substrate-binding protein